MSCERCGSFAINHAAHGRDGSEPSLCDVCYWRQRTEQCTASNAAKDAEIASLRDRLRDTAQILIAEVGATGPADADEVARKAVSQIARLREALVAIRDSQLGPDRGSAQWELTLCMSIAHDALARAPHGQEPPK